MLKDEIYACVCMFVCCVCSSGGFKYSLSQTKIYLNYQNMHITHIVSPHKLKPKHQIYSYLAISSPSPVNIMSHWMEFEIKCNTNDYLDWTERKRACVWVSLSTEREMFEFRVFGSFRVQWNVPIQININLCYVGQQIRCQFMVFIANSLLYPLHLNRSLGLDEWNGNDDRGWFSYRSENNFVHNRKREE